MSETCLGVKEAFHLKLNRGSLVYNKLHLKVVERFQENVFKY